MAVVDRADSQRREIRMRRMDNCVGHGNLVVWQDINKVHSVVGPACAQMIERQHLDVDALLFCGWNYVEYEIRIVPNIRRFVSQGYSAAVKGMQMFQYDSVGKLLRGWNEATP